MEKTTTEQILESKSEEKKPAKKPRAKKKKAERQVSYGHAYIKATYNNTFITLADQKGNVLAWSTAGKTGFKGPKKSTPYAASTVARDVIEKVSPYGLKEVSVFVRGVGPGRDAAIRALHANGLQISAIKDVTPVPHNGCRPKGRRRV